MSSTVQKKGLLQNVNFKIDISELHIKVDKLQCGNLRNNFPAWTNITSGTFILNIVQQGLKLIFTGGIPTNVQFEYKRLQFEQSIIDEEVPKPIWKNVILTTNIQEGDFFSNLFIRSKKDGSYRTILNKKMLNRECEISHFKMESIKQVMHMIKPNTY